MSDFPHSLSHLSNAHHESEDPPPDHFGVVMRLLDENLQRTHEANLGIQVEVRDQGTKTVLAIQNQSDQLTQSMKDSGAQTVKSVETFGKLIERMFNRLVFVIVAAMAILFAAFGAVIGYETTMRVGSVQIGTAVAAPAEPASMEPASTEPTFMGSTSHPPDVLGDLPLPDDLVPPDDPVTAAHP